MSVKGSLRAKVGAREGGLATRMIAGLLLLAVLSGVLAALAAALSGADLPLTFLAYTLGGNTGLLVVAAWNGRHVALRETTGGRPWT